LKVRSKQEVILQYHFQREVDGKTIFCVLHHMGGGRLNFEETLLDQRLY